MAPMSLMSPHPSCVLGSHNYMHWHRIGESAWPSSKSTHEQQAFYRGDAPNQPTGGPEFVGALPLQSLGGSSRLSGTYASQTGAGATCGAMWGMWGAMCTGGQ